MDGSVVEGVGGEDEFEAFGAVVIAEDVGAVGNEDVGHDICEGALGVVPEHFEMEIVGSEGVGGLGRDIGIGGGVGGLGVVEVGVDVGRQEAAAEVLDHEGKVGEGELPVEIECEPVASGYDVFGLLLAYSLEDDVLEGDGAFSEFEERVAEGSIGTEVFGVLSAECSLEMGGEGDWL